MKAKCLLIALLFALCFTGANAQYFYHLYGTGGGLVPLTGGVSTYPALLGNGTLQTGWAGAQVQVTLTDAFGNWTINNIYELRTGAGVPMPVKSAVIAESNTPGIMVFGTYIDPGSQLEGIFCLMINGAGVITGTTFHQWAGPIVSQMEFKKVFGTGGATFFAVGKGYVGGPAPGDVVMVVRFNVAGGVVWSGTYRETGTAAYLQGEDGEVFVVNGDLYVVGSYESVPGAPKDGFVLQLSAATGAYINGIRVGGLLIGGPDDGIFTSVTTYRPTPNFNGGLLVGGYSDSRAGANYDAWGVKIRPNLTVFQSQLYDYAAIPNQNNYCYDVLERKTPAGPYTYFFAGTVAGGSMGLDDIHVVKTDDNMASLMHFTYGTAMLNEEGAYICDQDPANPVGSPGLFVLGTGVQSAVDEDFLAIGAYYNGITACNAAFANAAQFLGPSLVNNLPSQRMGTLNPVNATAVYIQCVTDLTICSAGAVGGGSNAKRAEGENLESEVALDLSAVAGLRDLSAICIESSEAVNAEVVVTDLLGAELYRAVLSLRSGKNPLPSAAVVSAGILVVKVTTEAGLMRAEKLLIQ